MSLDGFISGPGGDMAWMVDYLGPNPVVDQLIKQTGAILAGNRTFGGDDPYKGKPGEGEVFGGGWDGPQFVLTHRPPAEQVPGAMFVGDGTRLFGHPGGKTVRLAPISVTHTPQVTNVWFRVTP
jgi:hypothetical protein